MSEDESGEVEFKSTAAASLDNPDIPEKIINEQVIKTVAAFLNTDGGTLGIGIADDKTILGIGNDLDLKSMDLDKYINWLTTLLITSCGIGPATACTRIRWEIVDGKTVVLVDVNPSPKAVYVKTSKNVEAFYVRANNTTQQLALSEIHDWFTARRKS
ncbi:MAG: AlbA family DNA-binding domain-containing protein [Pseudonocardiaceae bacterium]